METEEQLTILRQEGCDEVQGFLISPAVPGEQFRTMLHDLEPASSSPALAEGKPGEPIAQNSIVRSVAESPQLDAILISTERREDAVALEEAGMDPGHVPVGSTDDGQVGVSATLESIVIIDEAVLDELRELDDEGGGFFEEVVQAYVKDAPVMVDDLRAGIGGGNVEKITRVAHSLKTSSFQLRAQGLGELCRQVEEKSRGGSCEGLEALLPAIESQVVAVCATLTTRVEATTRLQHEPSGS